MGHNVVLCCLLLAVVQHAIGQGLLVPFASESVTDHKVEQVTVTERAAELTDTTYQTSGFAESGSGLDINECELNTDTCSCNAKCINTEESFECECFEGYEGDGFICKDINECELNTDTCSCNAKCINTEGSFECKCFKGYEGNGFICKGAGFLPIWLWPLISNSDGVDGRDGEKGEKGWPGAPGDGGMEGPQGMEEGEKGDTGEMGMNGNNGFVGATGAKGMKGETGMEGSPGMDITSAETTFVVWGQANCPPTQGTQLLHQGRVASPRSSDSGSGSNYLCLPESPTFGVSNPDASVQASIVGVKYATAGEPFQQLDNTAVPCAVCYTTQAVQLMIPGRAVCPSESWRREYSGYLMSSRDTPSTTLQSDQINNAHFRTEYICVSSNATSVPDVSVSSNEAEIYHVHLDCEAGPSLACSSRGYVTEDQLTCVLCTLNV